MKASDIRKHLATLEAAAASYRKTVAALHAQRGVYTAGELERREREALGTFQRSVAEIEPALEQASAWAQSELAAIGASDPVQGLDPSELARATGRWPFIREDGDTLPLGTLAERARQAVASGDKVEATLHLRAARQRLHTLDGPEKYDNARYDLEAVLPELEGVCIDVARRDTAQAVLEAAQTVASRAGSLSYFIRAGTGQRLPTA